MDIRTIHQRREEDDDDDGEEEADVDAGEFGKRILFQTHNNIYSVS